MANSQTSVYRPDEHMDFVSIRDVEEILRNMRYSYDRLVLMGIVGNQAFFEAYLEQMIRCQNGRIPCLSLGGDGFSAVLRVNVASWKSFLASIVKGPLRWHKEQLQFHDEVKLEKDPLRLFEMGTDSIPEEASVLTRRKVGEARRLLAAAIQLAIIDANDVPDDLADDVKHVTALAEKRIFVTGRSEEVYVVAALSDRNSYRVHDVPKLFFTEREARQAAADIRRSWKRLGVKRRSKQRLYLSLSPWTCRVAHRVSTVESPEEEDFLILLISDDKSSADALAKYERYHDECEQGTREDSVLMDRRRWRYIVMGTMQDGKIVPADAEALKKFSDYTRDRLWRAPLRRLPDSLNKNSQSSPEFKDIKTVGRFYRTEAKRTVAGTCEQQCMTVTQYLSAERTSGDERHELYVLRKLLRFCCAKWWPESKGINWSDPAFHRSTLWRARKNLATGNV